MREHSFHADAYRRSLETEVRACREVEGVFEVVLADSVLRPEGGGQPADAGQVDGQPVLGLRATDQGEVSHRLASAVQGRVRVELDWARRFDHMQQHTAQHLVTAIAGRSLGWRTTAFHLGVEHSDLEFDVPTLADADLARLLAEVNAAVRQARPVTSRWVDQAEYDRLEVRSRLLPEGLTGPYRLVDIQGLDLNTCGGTHVANTAEVQAVAFAGTESLRGGTRLFYLAGGRVLSRVTDNLARERELNRILSCGPAEHAGSVERIQQEQRRSNQRVRALVAELAERLGAELAARPAPASLHRPDDDMAFLQATARAMLAVRPDAVALLTAGQSDGVFVLAGPAELVAAKGPAVAEALEGRGGGKAELFQGKAGRIGRRDRALAILTGPD